MTDVFHIPPIEMDLPVEMNEWGPFFEYFYVKRTSWLPKALQQDFFFFALSMFS